MDNPEKLATQGTQEEDKENKNTTQYVLDTTIPHTNTNNVNKTWILLQTTGNMTNFLHYRVQSLLKGLSTFCAEQIKYT